MKTIFLKQLRLTNFKGVKNLTIDFKENTDIKGANATGKTTIYDAFLWLFFGKDSQDKADFEVKPKNTDGTEIHHLETEVMGIVSIDGKDVELKRLQTEKWVKPRGQINEILKGNEQAFTINNVPKKLSEYNDYIKTIASEDLFKLITRTSYFTSLNWKDMRRGLMGLVSIVSDEELLNQTKYSELAKQITGKSLEDFQKELKADISKNKKSVKEIPARIKEQNRGVIDVDCTLEEIESKIEKVDLSISKIDAKINDANKQVEKEILAKGKIKEEILRLENLKAAIVEKAEHPTNDKEIKKQKDLRELDEQIKGKTDLINSKQLILKSNINVLDSYNKSNIKLNNTRNELISEYRKLKKEYEDAQVLVFDENAAVCPTCGAELTGKHLQDVKDKFATDKEAKIEKTKKALADNIKEGKATKISIGANNTLVLGIKTKNESIEKEISALEEEVMALEGVKIETKDIDTEVKPIKVGEIIEYKEIVAKIEAKTKEIGEDIKVDNSKLIEEKRLLNVDRDGLKDIKSNILSNDKIAIRVAELQKEQQEVAQYIADLEKTQFQIKEFVFDKISAVENQINSLFTTCKFQMFETNYTNPEDTQECCKCLVGGVEFNSANTASKINVGLDIIKVFSNKFNIKAPCFLDNRESITNIINIDTQIINLIVDPTCKTLKIN